LAAGEHPALFAGSQTCRLNSARRILQPYRKLFAAAVSAWDAPNVWLKSQMSAHQTPQKTLIHIDSWTMVMEVEIG